MASDRSTDREDRERVDQILARLLPLDLVGELFPAEFPYCRQRDAVHLVCTRRAGHDGPHVAHGGPNVALSMWWNE